MVLLCLKGGVGVKKRQTSLRFLHSLREVLTKRRSGGGLSLDTGQPQVLAIKAMSTTNVVNDVDEAPKQHTSVDEQ